LLESPDHSHSDRRSIGFLGGLGPVSIPVSILVKWWNASRAENRTSEQITAALSGLQVHFRATHSLSRVYSTLGKANTGKTTSHLTTLLVRRYTSQILRFFGHEQPPRVHFHPASYVIKAGILQQAINDQSRSQHSDRYHLS
jgi:hypothetical protein